MTAPKIRGQKRGSDVLAPWDPFGHFGPLQNDFLQFLVHYMQSSWCCTSYLQRIEIMKKHDFEVFSYSPKNNAFRLYRCYTTLHLLSVKRILSAPMGTRQNAVLDTPRHSATFYGTPRNRRIDGTLPADFFSAPDPCFWCFAHIVNVSTYTRNIVNVTCNVHKTFSPHRPHRKRWNLTPFFEPPF